MPLDPYGSNIGVSQAVPEPESAGGGIGGGIAGEAIGQIMNAFGVPTMAMRSARTAWAANTAHDFISKGVEVPKEVLSMLPEENQKAIKAVHKTPEFQAHAAEVQRMQAKSDAIENAARYAPPEAIMQIHNALSQMDLTPEAAAGAMNTPDFNRSTAGQPPRGEVGSAVTKALFPTTVLQQGNETDQALAKTVYEQGNQNIEKQRTIQQKEIANMEDTTKRRGQNIESKRNDVEQARNEVMAASANDQFLNGMIGHVMANDGLSPEVKTKYINQMLRNRKDHPEKPDYLPEDVVFGPRVGKLDPETKATIDRADKLLNETVPASYRKLAVQQAGNTPLDDQARDASHMLLMTQAVDAYLAKAQAQGTAVNPAMGADYILGKIHMPLRVEGFWGGTAMQHAGMLADDGAVRQTLQHLITQRAEAVGGGADDWRKYIVKSPGK